MKLSSSCKEDGRIKATIVRVRRVFNPVEGQQVQLQFEQTVSTGPEANQKRTYFHSALMVLTPEDAESLSRVIRGEPK